MTGSSPVHTAVRFSYLSSERAWMENHYGLYNLAGIFLVVGNIRWEAGMAWHGMEMEMEMGPVTGTRPFSAKSLALSCALWRANVMNERPQEVQTLAVAPKIAP